MRRLLFILVMLSAFIIPGAKGQTALKTATVSSDDPETLDLSEYASFIIETDKNFSFEQIRSGKYDSLFRDDLPAGDATTFKRNVWVRVACRFTLGRPCTWVLHADKLYSHVTAYLADANGKVTIQKSGWSLPPVERTIVDPEVLFKYSTSGPGNLVIYLHIQTDLRWSTLDQLQFTLVPEAHWNNMLLKNYIFLFIYAGICLLASFYWLVTYLYSLRINYLLLIAATLSALGFCLDLYGITGLTWPRDPWYSIMKYWPQLLWLPVMVISHFAISSKANSFVTQFPARLLKFYWFNCYTTVAFLLLTPIFLPWKYAHSISLVIVLFSMISGVILVMNLFFKRGFGTTGFAFLAILPIFIGMGTYIFSALGILSGRYKILIPIGALSTVIMYFYGMVHYLRAIREKRNNEILKNDELIRRQNVMLENTVAERTQALKISNEELSKAMLTLKETHEQLLEAEKLKADEKINTLLKEQELRSVSNLLDVQEQERKRIATDLHDRLGSMLSTVKLYFNSVDPSIKNKEQYGKANVLLDEACDEVRKISHDLVSGELVKFGLVSALRQLAKTIEDTGQLKVQVLTFGMSSRLPSNAEIAIYRILQELMNNILKHAYATSVNIQLNRTQDNLNIVVEDNGSGFDVSEAKMKGGMGLTNIETRIGKLNGTVAFDSGKGKGTTTVLDIPLNANL